jgi:hypothetical protein
MILVTGTITDEMRFVAQFFEPPHHFLPPRGTVPLQLPH